MGMIKMQAYLTENQVKTTTVMMMNILMTKVVAVVVAGAENNTLAAEDHEVTVKGIMILSIIQGQRRASLVSAI